jgi:hypothetical protein
MASSTSKASPQKSTPVALSAGTHSWRPTPEAEAFQDDLVAILRERGITRLDTARSYVSPPTSPPSLTCCAHLLFTQNPDIIEIFRVWVLRKSH